MKIVIEENYEDLSKVIADLLEEEIRRDKDIVLGLATGSTMKGMYRELVKKYEEEELDFSNIKTFNLDEYIGIEADDPGSYRYYMEENFFKHVNIKKENAIVPNGNASDLNKYGEDYDTIIKNAGGIDIQILGVGTNGHIGFNEPDKKLSSRTTVVELTQSTIDDNSRFFNSIEEMPKTAITMGIGGILKAKKIILLANGIKKYEAIHKLLNEDIIYTEFPLSFLKAHPDVTIIIDKEAYTGKEIDPDGDNKECENI